MKEVPLKIKIFLISTYLFTLLSACFLINTRYVPMKLDYGNNVVFNLLFFSILIAVTESFTVIYRNISFSTTFAIEAALFILFGPIFTILVIIIGFSFRVIKVNEIYKHFFNTPFYGTLFNYCTLAVPVLYGSFVYNLVGGTYNCSEKFFIDLVNNIPQILLFSIICFLVNTCIISILGALTSNKKVYYLFLNNVKIFFLNILTMVPFGIILAITFEKYEHLGVLLVLGPIVLARYTFSLYIDSKSQYVQTVNAFMHAMEARDKYTEGHSQRVAEISNMIAKELKFTEGRLEQLNMAALLHDIGKIGIDDSILHKPGKLTNEEFTTIKNHPEIGYNIIKAVRNLGYVSNIVRHHHERYDGRGYPTGKKADELDIDVFIIQLADSIDAMATDRPYREALSKEEIIDEIKKNKGTQFHPKVVEAYFRAFEK